MTFEREGYLVADLGTASRFALACARVSLSRKAGCALEETHLHHAGDIRPLQAECRALVADAQKTIVKNEEALIGTAIGSHRAQKMPYLRIARPGDASDNVGIHKDTWYGCDASEVSVWIPLVDVDERSALRVLPGSHLQEFETEEDRPQAERGSLAHALGFLYAPKRLKQPVEMTPVPLKLGQVLVMSVALLHGQEKNESSSTRWSMDCRAAPVTAKLKERALAYA